MLAVKTSGPSAKSESNYFSSLARLQNAAALSAETRLLGSSLTGRLPDHRSGFGGVVNMGCDGSSAMDVLRAIDRGILPGARSLIVEGNTLFKSMGPQSGEIEKSIESLWFQVGMKFPMLSAGARPSGLVYSWLRSRNFGMAEGPDGPVLPNNGFGMAPETRNLCKAEMDLLEELVDISTRLGDRGHQLWIVILPPGAPVDAPNQVIPRAWSRLTGIPFIDLSANLPPGCVKYTDAVHMNPSSAAAALRTILAEINQPFPESR